MSDDNYYPFLDPNGLRTVVQQRVAKAMLTTYTSIVKEIGYFDRVLQEDHYPILSSQDAAHLVALKRLIKTFEGDYEPQCFDLMAADRLEILSQIVDDLDEGDDPRPKLGSKTLSELVGIP